MAQIVKMCVCLCVCQEDQEELSPSPTEEPWPKKFPEPLSWRSDEEDEDSDFGEEQRDRYLKVWFSTYLKRLFKADLFKPTEPPQRYQLN